MDRDLVADEAGREHTGGLGEREGAETSGGAAAGLEPTRPAPEADADEPAMYEPSREERQGLGDVGGLGESATGGAPDVGERERRD